MLGLCSYVGLSVYMIVILVPCVEGHSGLGVAGRASLGKWHTSRMKALGKHREHGRAMTGVHSLMNMRGGASSVETESGENGGL